MPKPSYTECSLQLFDSSFVRLLSQHLQENLSQFSPLLLIWSPSHLPAEMPVWHQAVSLFVWRLLDVPSRYVLSPCHGFVPVLTPLPPNSCCDSPFSFLLHTMMAPVPNTHREDSSRDAQKPYFSVSFHPQS